MCLRLQAGSDGVGAEAGAGEVGGGGVGGGEGGSRGRCGGREVGAEAGAGEVGSISYHPPPHPHTLTLLPEPGHVHE